MFSAAVTLMVPSLLPLAGVTVSHPLPPVEATVHDVLLWTTMLCVLPVELNAMLFVLMDRYGPGAACVTCTVSVRVVPAPSFHVTVTVAERWVVVLFSAAVTLIVPSLLPLAGVTVSHPLPPVEATVHDVLLWTTMLCVLPVELNVMLFVLMDR